MDISKIKIGIIGLGYVGIPLAIEFGKVRTVIGFDISSKRIDELKKSFDSTFEISAVEFSESKNLSLTSHIEDLKDCNFYIVTVPTPVNKFNQPDFSCLVEASQSIGKILKPNDIVVYESTVYPGATEEVCVPILEEFSGLKYISRDISHNDQQGFYCGYSPERINPGDKLHKLANIVKITAASTEASADIVDAIYRQIIKVGTYKAESIKIAEAAKVIENTQRDLNIALINELAIIFSKLNIDTESVLRAAGTKWNFLNFRPGLVGGHCIGVDPYYLTYKAEEIGYKPEIILSGRRLNDNMSKFVVDRSILAMTSAGVNIRASKILILGFTFKENCPDIRNTKIIDIVNLFSEFGCKVDIYDPWASLEEAKKEYKVTLLENIFLNNQANEKYKENYDLILVAVSHNEFKELDIKDLKSLGKKQCIIYDLKYVFSKNETDIRL